MRSHNDFRSRRSVIYLILGIKRNGEDLGQGLKIKSVVQPKLYAILGHKNY